MSIEPLRILVVVSRPLALLVPVEHGGEQFEVVSPVPREPVEAVHEGLRQVFLDDRTPAQVRYLPWARLGDLQAALAEPYDVVHFVGHGAEDGRLLLEADDGSADLMSPQRLAEAMAEAGVRLALLSACHSGAAGRAQHEAGIPNVVMVDERYPMHADAAALFNRQFYARLARGRRPLEAFEAGVRAVRVDRRFGDEAPPPENKRTGEIEPRYGERFDKIIADDRPLVEGIPAAGYEELHPSKARCAVTREEVFVGREAEMIKIIRRMRTARLVTLTGPGGIGKTALARRVALWHAERGLFRDGVVEVNAQGARGENELLSRFAVALREFFPDFRLDPRQPWVSLRAALSGRWLVLLDSAEGLSPEAIGRLGEPLLGRLEELHLLVTSHAPLRLVKYEQAIPIDELPVGDEEWVGPAERMFIAYTPQERQAEIVRRHFEAVRDICRELGGYPLGILLEAAQLSDERETPERLLETLRANMVEALQYAQAAGFPPRHKSVGAALKGSHDKLGAAARQLLAHIAVFPGGAGEEMLVALEGLDEAGWRKAEREVRDVGLVRWEEGRYRMLPPIRAWAQTTLPADELDAYRLRATRWLAEQAGTWDAMLRPSEERRAFAAEMAQKVGQKVENLERVLMLTALTAFDRERENLLAAVEWAYEGEEWELTRDLVDQLNTYFNIRALWADWVRIGKLAVKAARREANRKAEGIALNNLGLAYADQGCWDEAIGCYKKALAICRKLGERHGEGNILNNLGSVYLEQSRWEEAIECCQKALGIFRKLGDRHGEGQALGNLGIVYRMQGRWDEAIECLEESLRVCRDLGDRDGEGQTLGNLGNIYADQGRWEEAIRCYKEDLAICRELGDRRGELKELLNLGNIYADQGRWDKAIECFEQNLAICRELGDKFGEGQTLANLGALYAQQGRWGKAIEWFEKALGICRRLGSMYGEGLILGNLGNLYAQQGRWKEAIECYEESLRIKRELGDRHGEGATLMNLGNLYRLQGRWDGAIRCYEKALSILCELGDRHGEGATLMNLGNLYRERGELDKALEAAGQALFIFQELKAYPDLVACCRLMASLNLRADDAFTCFIHLAQALSLALQIHFKPVVETLDAIVRTAKGLGDKGRWKEVAALGFGLHGLVVEMEKKGWKNKELEAVGVLSRRVCAVIALAGKSRLEEVPEEKRAEAGETALEMAKAVDEATGGVWGLEEWVGESVNG